MKGKIGAIFLAVVMVVGLVLVGMSATRVPAGYVGVVYNVNGGVVGEVLTQGWHIVAPTKKVTTYSIGIEQSYLTADSVGDSKKDESFSTPTSDGKSLTVDLEFSYKFDVERIAETFTMFKGQSGEDVKNTFIKPKMKAWTQEVTAKYPVTDVFGDKRQELNETLDVYLKAKFEQYGIIIDTVNFTRIDTDDETKAAIQKKVNAQQELELAQIEAQTAQIQAEKDKEVALIAAQQEKEKASINAEKAKIEAQAKAERAKIEAEGEATAIRIAAEAEAEANKKLAQSLTPELIEMKKYEKWNGQVSQVQVQGTATPIIDLTE